MKLKPKKEVKQVMIDKLIYVGGEPTDNTDRDIWLIAKKINELIDAFNSLNAKK